MFQKKEPKGGLTPLQKGRVCDGMTQAGPEAARPGKKGAELSVRLLVTALSKSQAQKGVVLGVALSDMGEKPTKPACILFMI